MLIWLITLIDFKMLTKTCISGIKDVLGSASGKEPACQCKRCLRPGSIPGSGRTPGVGQGNPLQYSCLQNSTDKGAWSGTIHRVSKSQILKWHSIHTHTWNKSNVVVVYSLHCLIWLANILLRIFWIYVHEKYWSIIFLSCDVFTWFY